MSTAPRNARQSGITAFQWVAGLSLLIGIGAGAIVLVILFSNAPAPAESSLVQGPVSSTATSEPTDQALLAANDEPSESTGAETPEDTPASTPDTAEPNVEPTPESDSATFAESPPATATATSESESSGSEVQDVSESGTSDPAAPTGSNKQTTRIEIPAIGVDAPVEVKSIDDNGVMENPSSSESVAWYDFTARPDDQGNAVFAGHLDYDGVGPAVFWELGSVSLGDEVNVTQGDGSIIRYRITGVRSVPADADASNIVATGDVAKITIITCDGSFDPSSQEYDQRIVVTGERVG